MRLSALILVSFLVIQHQQAQQPAFFSDNPLAHTYSIVAIDKETGEMGVAVQSHWFSVGSVVSWAEAGVGAIATQSFVNPAFGPDGLALLKMGFSAEETLQTLINRDPGKEVRQLAIVDAAGRVAAFTGEHCIREAGDRTGDGFSVQANLMENPTVQDAMYDAFEKSGGKPLAERLILALEAAQSEGGDIRGKQSAALLVVGAQATGKPWKDRKIDLRVDDHPQPLVELRRLYQVHKAYQSMNTGDVALEEGRIEDAMHAYRTAMEMFPENLEMKFWTAVTMLNIDRPEEAMPLLKVVFTRDPAWRKLFPRLKENGLLAVEHEIYARVMSLK